MNQVLPYLLYLPVNIAKEDTESLRAIYDIAENTSNVIAINQTQPHKSNAVMKEIFASLPNTPVNVDAIIKNEKQKLLPYDLNGTSFVGWFREQVGSFSSKHIIIVGVGGAGEPIAREIARQIPRRLTLVDIANKEVLAKELSLYVQTDYVSSIRDSIVSEFYEGVLINAAGKEGVEDDSGVKRFLDSHSNESNIFVDLRPHLTFDIVEIAKGLGWDSYSGFGMNARNDYTLLEKIAKTMKTDIITFKAFETLVKQAS